MEISAAKNERIEKRHLRLFRIISITVVPALLFISLELALRIAGYGYPTSAVIKRKVDGKDVYCDNVRFGWRFFPPNISRDFDPFVFPVDKSPDTYRIFVLGGSAAMGVPVTAFSFGRILRVMLEQARPDVNFEVITVATAAINSHVVREIAKSCARCEPDLFVVYLGNNEVVGPYGAGTVFAPLSGNLAFIRLGIAFKATRVGQLLTNLSQSLAAGKSPAVWKGMAMFLQNQVRSDDRRLETVYEHFRRNLEDIGGIARKSGAPVIFCTVGSNLKDSPPFASLHRQDLTIAEKQKWDELYQQGITSETGGDYGEALKWYLAADAIDDCYADLHFRLGRCYWAMAEYEEASESYIEARHFDTLRFRPDTQINETIRSVAGGKTAEGVYLTDSAKVFEEHSPHNTPGDELLYEHVHLNFTGNYILAETVFRQIEEMLPERIRQRRADKPLSAEADCARELAYTGWDKYDIAKDVLDDYIKKPPFTNQLYHEQKIRQATRRLEELGEIYLTPEALEKSAAEHRDAIEKNPSDWQLHWKYGGLLWEYLKDDRAAIEQYRQVLKLLPYYSGAYDRLGLLLGRNWDLNSAITYNLEAIKLKPTHSEAHFNLGFIYQLQGSIDKAIKCYSKALRLKPSFTSASENLGALLYQQGKIDQAEQVYRGGLSFAPDAANLHYDLAVILTKKGRITEAIDEYKAALQPKPGTGDSRNALKKEFVVSAYQDLGALLYKQGRVDEAIATYQKGLLVVPDASVLHYNLAVILNVLGRKDQAVEQLRTAVRLDPNYVRAREFLENILKTADR